MTYDLLIKGGTLIDPAQKIHAKKDVAFANGLVAEVGDDLSEKGSFRTVDAGGRIVTPGMIDLHVHVFEGISHFGVDPDLTCLAKGVTTVVDTGSAGADVFPGFRKYIINLSETRVYAELNISSQGMITREVGELDNPAHADVAKAVDMIERHRDVILGVKVRLTRESIVSERLGMSSLQRTREAADAVGLPIMVHPQGAWCVTIDDILEVMVERDILTHCFHGVSCGILDDAGKVRSSVRDAIDRGVIFDVGHGSGSFSWEVVEAALDQGIEPQTISSDLHVYNLHGPVYDLATCVTKFLHLGFSLDDAFAKVTSVAAEAIQMQDKIGTLAVGAWGDAVVFDLLEGEFELVDSLMKTRTGKQKLVPLTVVKGGQVVA